MTTMTARHTTTEKTAQPHYPAAILVVSDAAETRTFLQCTLAPYCTFLELAEHIPLGESLRQRCHFDLMIVATQVAGESGIAWLQRLRAQEIQTEVIFITAHADLVMVLHALRLGAADFMIKPLQKEPIIAAVQRCLDRRQIERARFLLRHKKESYNHLNGLIGQTAVIQEMCQIIRRVAPTPSTILIEGETGTGKELVAQAIHEHSQRSGAFVTLNCGSMSPELLESELFGHLRGAFTNAYSHREGLFSYAQGGTLFLDEIGEMPLLMQTKLLRALEYKMIRPVGADQEISVNTRVIAATNRHLYEAVKAGYFREDLYYRLNVLIITVPPLRDRLDDLPLLATHFSKTLASGLGVASIPFTHEDFIKLQNYHWPGNVRELKNVIERSLLLGKLPEQCFPDTPATHTTNCTHTSSDATQSISLDLPLAAVEKHYIVAMLAHCQGNKSEAARRLNISRKTLDRKLQ
jgi:two-component system NtrC family response regulator